MMCTTKLYLMSKTIKLVAEHSIFMKANANADPNM